MSLVYPVWRSLICRSHRQNPTAPLDCWREVREFNASVAQAESVGKLILTFGSQLTVLHAPASNISLLSDRYRQEPRFTTLLSWSMTCLFHRLVVCKSYFMASSIDSIVQRLPSTKLFIVYHDSSPPYATPIESAVCISCCRHNDPALIFETRCNWAMFASTCAEGRRLELGTTGNSVCSSPMV